MNTPILHMNKLRLGEDEMGLKYCVQGLGSLGSGLKGQVLPSQFLCSPPCSIWLALVPAGCWVLSGPFPKLEDGRRAVAAMPNQAESLSSQGTKNNSQFILRLLRP